MMDGVERAMRSQSALNPVAGSSAKWEGPLAFSALLAFKV